MQADDLIRSALARGQQNLSEYESKKLLAYWGIPITREGLAHSVEEAVSLACHIGFPVVLKASSPKLLHKSDTGAIELNIKNEEDLRAAYERLTQRAPVELEGVLVSEMIPGQRELVVGLIRDAQFGPCVMLGIGGIMTEVFKDRVFRLAPLDMIEGRDMAEELRFKEILGPFRGQKPIDMDSLCRILVAVGQMGLELPHLAELDINPLIITPAGQLVAVDALAIVREAGND